MRKPVVLDPGSIPLHFAGGAFTRAIMDWYSKSSVSHPWRDDWKKYRSPYHVWVSEIMLQQTLITVVTPVYQQFVIRFPTLVDLASASEDEIRESVRGLGYYRRFRLLHAAAQQLTGKDQSSFTGWPTTFMNWKALPGVGDYTAAAVGSIAFNIPVPVVDGNVERVLCRVFDLRMPPNLPSLKKQFFKTLESLVCRQSPGDFNQGVMELGQRICTTTKPSCSKCPLQAVCFAFERSSQGLAPAAKLRKETVDVALNLVLTKSKNRIGIYQRPDTAKFLKSTAGFCTFLAAGKEMAGDGFPGSLDLSKCSKLGSIRHHITNHNIRAEIYLANGGEKVAGYGKIRWIDPELIERNLVSNLDRKAWMVFLKNFPLKSAVSLK
jgi:A/G-specific adenine glycosylase